MPNCERTQTYPLPRHQNTASLLLPAPRLIRYETMFSREEIAGPNAEFSRHAARKPMVARYRRMPHGRLQFIVGTSLPPLTFCNLPKLPSCGFRSAQINLLQAPENYFDAGFRQLMGCVRRRDHLPNCERAQTFDLPHHQNTANLLLRGPRFVRYETMFSREEIAGAND